MDDPVTHRELETFKELMESENNRLAEEDDRQNQRLEQIESRDGEKWRKAMAYIGTAILGAVLAIVFAKIGL